MRDRLGVTFRTAVFHANLLLLSVLVVLPAASAQTAGSTAASSPVVQQKLFATPQAAADALIQGAKTYNVPQGTPCATRTLPLNSQRRPAKRRQ
jgi:hypothetical protein